MGGLNHFYYFQSKRLEFVHFGLKIFAATEIYRTNEALDKMTSTSTKPGTSF